MRKLLAGSILAAATVLGFQPDAKADLIFEGTVDLTGTGLGAVPTILTLQSGNGQNGGPTQTGQIFCDLANLQCQAQGQVQPGQTQFITLAQALAGNPNPSLGFIFNPNEPGQTQQQPITLNALEAGVFTNPPSFPALFTAAFMGVVAPGVPTSEYQLDPNTIPPSAPGVVPIVSPQQITFPNGGQGTGKSGFLFGLNATESAEFAAFLSGPSFNPNDLVGLAATVTNVSGGHETFFASPTGFTPVPEPMSAALLGTGLVGVGLAGVWRRGKSLWSRKAKRPALEAV